MKRSSTLAWVFSFQRNIEVISCEHREQEIVSNGGESGIPKILSLKNFCKSSLLPYYQQIALFTVFVKELIILTYIVKFVIFADLDAVL
jgi:hypothetical protein